MKQTVLAIGFLIGLAAQSPADKTLAAAQHKEDAEGDLVAAISGYRKAVTQAGGNRAVAARAQLRLGLALEKLGDANARAAYEQLLRSFADQKMEADQARSRLAGLSTPRIAGGVTQRTILRAPAFPGEPSPSGRYFPSSLDGAISVYDRVAGTTRLLVPKPPVASVYAGFSSISPDDKWLAYGVTDWNGHGQIMIIVLDGSTKRILMDDAATAVAIPAGWSPDGKTIAAVVSLKSRENRSLHFVDVATGATRRRVEGLGLNPDVVWSPDGRWVAFADRNSRRKPIRVVSSEAGDPVDLVGGDDRKMLVGWLRDGRVVYTSDGGATPDLLAVPVANGKVTGAPQLLKKDIGAPDQLRASRHGELIGKASLNRVELLETAIDVAGGTLRDTPAVINTRFRQMSFGPDYSPDGKSLAYISGRRDQAEFGVFVAPLSGGETRRFDPPGPAVRVKWFPDGRSLLVTTNGPNPNDWAVYRMNLDSGKFEKLGATITRDSATNATISPDGRFLYYKGWPSASESGVARAVIRRLDLSSGAQTVVFSPEDAADGVRLFSLSPDGRQLLLSMRSGDQDWIELRSVDGGPAKTLYSYPKGVLSRAFGGLWWTADGQAILFHYGRNWGDELWTLRLDGGTPKKLLETGIIHNGSSHPDNRRIVMHVSHVDAELWLMEGLLRP